MESGRIEEALKVMFKVRNEAEEEVIKKEKEVKKLSTWPKQLAEDTKKWEGLWEGEFGKKVLQHQSNKLAENTTVVTEMNSNIQYCKQMISFKRMSQQRLAEQSRELYKNCQHELNRVQREISWLKDQVAEWKLKTVQNELIVEKMKVDLENTNMTLLDKRAMVEEMKADLEEQRRQRFLAELHHKGHNIMKEL
ncbi:unnamed protein product [Bursaphelenchus okinawaensis]|uniref:Uncharacterized protein n=1 Tax=Bursaphelenchus okinawaensis TaxID=465554 RepID=A0A811K4Y6_9BILA|nr:unnamed protein product [Bursaphelenchus okinawaensis]CAG9090783.1 unnamed protein product [Bursaphelenchus okinawaensis]